MALRAEARLLVFADLVYHAADAADASDGEQGTEAPIPPVVSAIVRQRVLPQALLLKGELVRVVVGRPRESVQFSQMDVHFEVPPFYLQKPYRFN
ncbi:MAG: hypothetical protein KBD50_00700 [Candidatus Pacebacteria bacterium]|nr:hypothetical protein [Candidatus Paceibacterota bacterium]